MHSCCWHRLNLCRLGLWRVDSAEALQVSVVQVLLLNAGLQACAQFNLCSPLGHGVGVAWVACGVALLQLHMQLAAISGSQVSDGANAAGLNLNRAVGGGWQGLAAARSQDDAASDGGNAQVIEHVAFSLKAV